MAFLRSINQIRNIQWGRSYHWDVKFEDGPPSPFNEFFPAQEVEEETASLQSIDAEAPGTSLKFPHKTASKSVRITFVDDASYTLYNWLENWYNTEILNDGDYISTLEEATKQITIQKLDSNQNVIIQTSYWVYPEDILTFRGNSSSQLNVYTIPFIIAGII